MLDTISVMKLFAFLSAGKRNGNRLSFPLFLFFVALVGVVGYFGIYRTVAIKVEKDRFLKAQESLEDLSEQIQAKIGKADQLEKDNSCRYQSLKFSRGARSCSIRLDMQYEKRAMDQANTLMKEAASLFGGRIEENFGQQKDLSMFVAPDINNRGDQIFSQNLEDINGLGCGIQYLYPVTQDATNPYIQRFDEILTINIYCSGDAKAEHFPVKN